MHLMIETTDKVRGVPSRAVLYGVINGFDLTEKKRKKEKCVLCGKRLIEKKGGKQKAPASAVPVKFFESI